MTFTGSGVALPESAFIKCNEARLRFSENSCGGVRARGEGWGWGGGAAALSSNAETTDERERKTDPIGPAV